MQLVLALKKADGAVVVVAVILVEDATVEADSAATVIDMPTENVVLVDVNEIMVVQMFIHQQNVLLEQVLPDFINRKNQAKLNVFKIS